MSTLASQVYSPAPQYAQPAEESWRTPISMFERLTKLVRATFVSQYQRLRLLDDRLPGEYLPPAEWDGLPAAKRHRFPVWPAVARWCLEKAVNPVHFIRHTLPLVKEKNRIPKKLITPSTLELYLEHFPNLSRREALQGSVPIQTTHLQMMLAERLGTPDVTEQQMLRCVLLDPGTPFSVLFRYATGVQRQDAEIMQRFEPAALLDYICEIDLCEAAYSTLLPNDFTRLAEELREQMLQISLYAATGAKVRTWRSRRQAS